MAKIMTEEQRAKRNEYQKQWKRNNPEKVKAYFDRYAIRKALQSFPTEKQRCEYLNKMNKNGIDRKAKKKEINAKYHIKKGMKLLQKGVEIV